MGFAFLILILMPSEMSAQTIQQQNKQFHWFYIKLGKKLDKKTGVSHLVVKKIGNSIESGTFADFVNVNKSGLKSGKIMIGPFTGKSEVETAIKHYRIGSLQNRNDKDKLPDENDDHDCYYFYTRPLVGKFARSVNFQRIPSRVVVGTQNQFLSTLTEGLTFEQLAIGPFLDYGLAEKSKFIFRKNGEMSFENTTEASNNSGLEEMTKKWKSIKVELVKLSKKKNSDKMLYRVKIKFPRKYFIEDAFQSFSFHAKFKDTINTSNTGFTLQGNLAMDNNPVISFSKGEAFAQTISVNQYKNAKISGFYIESIIFNNNEMIEQEKRYVLVK